MLRFRFVNSNKYTLGIQCLFNYPWNIIYLYFLEFNDYIMHIITSIKQRQSRSMTDMWILVLTSICYTNVSRYVLHTEVNIFRKSSVKSVVESPNWVMCISACCDEYTYNRAYAPLQCKPFVKSSLLQQALSLDLHK